MRNWTGEFLQKSLTVHLCLVAFAGRQSPPRARRHPLLTDGEGQGEGMPRSNRKSLLATLQPKGWKEEIPHRASVLMTWTFNGARASDARDSSDLPRGGNSGQSQSRPMVLRRARRARKSHKWTADAHIATTMSCVPSG